MNLQVSSARAEEHGPALRLFFQHLGDEDREASLQRALSLIAKGDWPTSGLLVCRDGANCLGVIMAQSLPGAAGLVWPPQAVPQDGREVVQKMLVEAAVAWLRRAGAKLIQAVLNSTDVAFAAPLERHGFRHITTLLFWQKELESEAWFKKGSGTFVRSTLRAVPAKVPDPFLNHAEIDDADLSANQLRCQDWVSCNQTLFRATLMETYGQTLDFPELNDLRSTTTSWLAIRRCRAGGPTAGGLRGLQIGRWACSSLCPRRTSLPGNWLTWAWSHRRVGGASEWR